MGTRLDSDRNAVRRNNIRVDAGTAIAPRAISPHRFVRATAARRLAVVRTVCVRSWSLPRSRFPSILLIGAGLLIRSFGKILTVNRGFETANGVIAAVNIPLDYDDARTASLTERLLDRVRELPGVRAAGTVNSQPIVGWDPGMGFGALDSSRNASGEVPWASWRFISTGYFQAMGIRILRGRPLTAADDHSAVRRVVVSEAVANFFALAGPRSDWPADHSVEGTGKPGRRSDRRCRQHSRPRVGF